MLYHFSMGEKTKDTSNKHDINESPTESPQQLGTVWTNENQNQTPQHVIPLFYSTSTWQLGSHHTEVLTAYSLRHPNTITSQKRLLNCMQPCFKKGGAHLSECKKLIPSVTHFVRATPINTPCKQWCIFKRKNTPNDKREPLWALIAHSDVLHHFLHLLLPGICRNLLKTLNTLMPTLHLIFTVSEVGTL